MHRLLSLLHRLVLNVRPAKNTGIPFHGSGACGLALRYSLAGPGGAVTGDCLVQAFRLRIGAGALNMVSARCFGFDNLVSSY